MARALPSPERGGEETGAPRILGACLQPHRPTTPIGRWFSMSNQRTSTESTTGHSLLRRPVVLPSTGAVRGALRGGVKAPSVGVARRRRAAAAAVPAAAPYFPAPRFPRHGNVAVRAPVRARGYGVGQRARCRCVAKRATALKARVLHARAWNRKLFWIPMGFGCRQMAIVVAVTIVDQSWSAPSRTDARKLACTQHPGGGAPQTQPRVWDTRGPQRPAHFPAQWGQTRVPYRIVFSC